MLVVEAMKKIENDTHPVCPPFSRGHDFHVYLPCLSPKDRTPVKTGIQANLKSYVPLKAGIKMDWYKNKKTFKNLIKKEKKRVQ